MGLGTTELCKKPEVKNPELGTSLFEIAQSLFALEQTLILGAMVLLKGTEA